MLEAQAAVQRYMDNKDEELDVDLRKDAEHKLHEAREEHDKEEADYLQKNDPKWAKFVKALGIAFYLYIGMQYAMASAVKGATSNGK
jgi:hypothetical protein